MKDQPPQKVRPPLNFLSTAEEYGENLLFFEEIDVDPEVPLMTLEANLLAFFASSISLTRLPPKKKSIEGAFFFKESKRL